MVRDSGQVRRRGGFTVVEILIVVIILGILAAIVIPQFVNASQNFRQGSLSAQLQTVRSAIEFYKDQHGGALPNLTVAWDPLTATSRSGGQVLGPYVQAVPVNPLNNSSSVVDGTGATAAFGMCGFVYDYNGGNGTGRIFGTDVDGKTITTY